MTRSHRSLVVALAAASFATDSVRAQCPGWSTNFGPPSASNGANARVYRMTSFDDQLGGGPRLIAGGNFTLCGTASAGGVAAWDGTSWSAVGTGPGLGANGEVFSVHGLNGFGITTSGPELYAGGRFTLIGGTAVNYISVWDPIGTAWLPLVDSNTLIDGTNDWVFTTLEYIDINSMFPDMVVGGRFTQAGGNAANYISLWDGGSATWSAMGSNTVGGGFNADVRALASDGLYLYAGGEFSLADGTPASLVAVWNPFLAAWAPLGLGLSGARVYDLCFFDPDGSGAQPNELYAGGQFTFSGSTAVSYVARWDGTNWLPVGAGFDSVVRDLFVHDSPCGQRLVAVGHFSMSGSTAVNHVAEYDGVSWQPIGAGVGVPGDVTLCANQYKSASAHELYVGGIFTTAASQPSSYIAAACRCPLAPFPVTQGEIAVTTNGAKASDYVVNLVDLNGTPPPPNTNWFAPKFHNEISPTAASEVWTFGNLGQVFGVCFDDLVPPNIYVTASTSYYIDGFGPGGAGAVYRLDRLNGDITTFATLPNTGPALGDVCHDPYHAQFFVSNFEDGKIYRLSSGGVLLQTYDPFAADNGAAGYAPLGERVWAVQVYNSRDLYFSVWLKDYGNQSATWPSAWPVWNATAGPNIANNAIFRCTLNPSTGAILAAQPVLVEVLPALPSSSYSNPCSDLRFSANNRRMLVTERGMISDGQPFPHEAEVLEYVGGGPGGWSANWALGTSQYWVGTVLTNRNASGGGDYDCAFNVLATADAMQFGNPDVLYGVQRIPVGGNTSGAGATSTSHLIDMDGNVALVDKTENGDVEAYRPNCSQYWFTYCIAKQNSAGCFPELAASGTPSASAGSGFVVQCTQVLTSKSGLLFYGLNGPSTNPFQGGTLCAQVPVQRTPVQNSGVSPLVCGGVFAIDMNAFAAGSLGGAPNPALSVAGTVVDCQMWSRDPASPSTTSLSDAVEYFVGP